MEVLEFSKANVSVSPAVPGGIDPNEHLDVDSHAPLRVLVFVVNRPNRTYQTGRNHPALAGGLNHSGDYAIRRLRTAYKTISAVPWRLSFCIRLARCVSTVDNPTSRSVATSLFDRP